MNKHEGSPPPDSNQINRRKFLIKSGLGLAAGIITGTVLSSEFCGKDGQVETAQEILDIISIKYGKIFSKLEPEKKKKAAEYIVERNQLLLKIIESIIQKDGKISQTEQNQFDEYCRLLSQQEIILNGYHETEKLLRSRSQQQLQELQKKLNPKSTKITSKKSDRHKRKPYLPNENEGREVKPGVYLDFQGETFGLGHFADRQEIDYPDLVDMKGRSTTGERITVELREPAMDAWEEMAEYVKDKYDIDLYAAEGHRTFAHQRELKKRYGAGASRPGRSEHHLGTTVDIFQATEKHVYKALVNYAEGSLNANFTPNCAMFGFIPTIKKEVWHFRYVGQRAANIYWQENGREILRQHTKMLR